MLLFSDTESFWVNTVKRHICRHPVCWQNPICWQLFCVLKVQHIWHCTVVWAAIQIRPYLDFEFFFFFSENFQVQNWEAGGHLSIVTHLINLMPCNFRKRVFNYSDNLCTIIYDSKNFLLNERHIVFIDSRLLEQRFSVKPRGRYKNSFIQSLAGYVAFSEGQYDKITSYALYLLLIHCRLLLL